MPKLDIEDLKDIASRISLQGGGAKDGEMTTAGGRIGYTHPLGDDSEIGIGASGHYAKGKQFKDAGVDRADVSYRKRLKDDSEIRARAGANFNKQAGKTGIDEVSVEYEIPFKKGGKVSAASKRADGIAQRGKTKGRIV